MSAGPTSAGPMGAGPVLGLPGPLLLPPGGGMPGGDRNLDSVASGLVHTLDVLRATAIRELNAHRGRGGVCITCGAQWPCERAQLAEHNLAVL